ncbi:MAG: hypothetical protein ACO3K7_06420 [Candidatus Marinamargulisbacteria bacterium]
MNIFKAFLCIIFITTSLVSAQATKLPDISVIGNFLGTHNDHQKSFDVNEIEFSFQHYLYPGIKANVFTALHKEANGQRAFELEEAYIDFTNLTHTITGESSPRWAVGSIIGKKYLNIGKTNPLHPEQWDFVDRDISTQQFLGGEEGLSAEGAQMSYLLPLPFFSQIELGYWTANAGHGHDDHHDTSDNVAYENRIVTGRLWNSFVVSDTQEVEFGTSYLWGNASSNDDHEQPTLLAFDATYNHDLGNTSALKLQSEVYMADFGDEDHGEKEEQRGGFIGAFYSLNKTYDAGVRYGVLGRHGDEGNKQTQWAWLITRQLTETSKFRVQYNTGENTESTLLLQFIFGMGPHAHVLQ